MRLWNIFLIKNQSKRIWLYKELLLEEIVRRVPLLYLSRPSVEPKLCPPHMTLYRNYEMSHTVKIIEPLVDFVTTSILQEYFLAIAHFHSFLVDLERIKKKYLINMMNISVQFLPVNTESFLSYEPVHSFVFVLYMDVVHPLNEFLAIKKKYDLHNRFINYLWEKYMQ